MEKHKESRNSRIMQRNREEMSKSPENLAVIWANLVARLENLEGFTCCHRWRVATQGHPFGARGTFWLNGRTEASLL